MKTRYFNEITVKDDILYKISLNDRLADEIYYYGQIQKYPQKYLFADYLGNESNGLQYVLKLKYYKNHVNFYEYSLNHSQFEISRAFDKLIDRLKTLHLNVDCETFSNNTFDINNLNKYILIDKTEQEYENFAKQSDLDIFYGILTLNGKKLLNFNEIWPIIKNKIHCSKYLKKLNLIHGDFCLANILIDNKFDLVFIDPRGSYHMKGCFGFYLYDYAKLLHSLSGNYESIIYNNYNFKQISSNEFYLSFENSFIYLIDKFNDLFDEQTLNYIKLIEGLLFISMCSRHSENKEHQMIMFLQGLQILNKLI